jgi:hypothetical protein
VIKLASYSNKTLLIEQISKLDTPLQKTIHIQLNDKIYSAFSTTFSSRQSAQSELHNYRKVFSDAYVMSTKHTLKKKTPVVKYKSTAYKHPIGNINTDDSSFIIKMATYNNKTNLLLEVAQLDSNIRTDFEIHTLDNTHVAYSTPFDTRALAKKKLLLYKKVFKDAYITNVLPKNTSQKRVNKYDPLKNPHIWTVEPLVFEQSPQVYHKYGSSQMHGMTIYLSEKRGEVRLSGAVAYLVKSATNIDEWYNNFYLKNKPRPSLKPLSIPYVNTTHINSEKKFIFYGIPQGDYYIIIESNYPASFDKKEKIYIAKKFKVEKYKKLIVLFSKAI